MDLTTSAINLGEFQRSSSITPSLNKGTGNPVDKFYYGVHKWTIQTQFTLLGEDDCIATGFSVPTDRFSVNFTMKLSRSVDPPGIDLYITCESDDPIHYEGLGTLKEFSPEQFLQMGKFNRLTNEANIGMVHQRLVKLPPHLANKDFVTICWHYGLRYQTKTSAVKQSGDKENRPTFQIERDGLENISDFTIHCGGKSFPVHKMVLANSSQVFHAMFLHKEFEENKKNEITVKNLNPETVDMMINFMYSHHLPEDLLVVNLENLLQAADMFDIEFLKSECGKRLVNKFLHVKNSSHLLYIGLKFNSKELVTSSRKMVLQNISTLCQTSKFADLVTVFPRALEKEADK